MRYRLIVPAYVETQIDACIAYIVQTLHNPDAARNVLDELVETYERLSCLPEAAPLCRDAYLRAKNYRIITLPHHHYLLIYRMEERIVYVVGFFHMRENYRDKL